jgi:hypothetical protein
MLRPVNRYGWPFRHSTSPQRTTYPERPVVGVGGGVAGAEVGVAVGAVVGVVGVRVGAGVATGTGVVVGVAAGVGVDVGVDLGVGVGVAVGAGVGLVAAMMANSAVTGDGAVGVVPAASPWVAPTVCAPTAPFGTLKDTRKVPWPLIVAVGRPALAPSHVNVIWALGANP